MITNTGRRRLGLPGRPALILDAGQSAEITDKQLQEMMKNRTSARWFGSGLLAVDGKQLESKPEAGIESKPKSKPALSSFVIPTPEGLPEGLTGQDIELYHKGGGWWRVYVNGFEVTDGNVRKAEAKQIAAEFE
jgi:hypothetical protein